MFLFGGPGRRVPPLERRRRRPLKKIWLGQWRIAFGETSGRVPTLKEKSTMSTKTFATLAAAAALGLAVSAQASPTVSPSSQADQTSVRVSIADLDLSKDVGSTTARQRILRAASFICGDETQQAGLSRYLLYRACVKATAGDAVATLDAQIASARTPDRTIVVSRR
jgi:UrcA family protein